MCKRGRSKVSNLCSTQKVFKRSNNSLFNLQIQNGKQKWLQRIFTDKTATVLVFQSRLLLACTSGSSRYPCTLLHKEETKFLLLYSCVDLQHHFSKRVLKCTELGVGHDQKSIDLSAAFNTADYKVRATCLQNQTGVNLNLSQMVHLIPLKRPKPGSCSSSLGVLAMASQQIRLHSPWSYTLLILSEADSADAQLPQCLEEHQLSQLE